MRPTDRALLALIARMDTAPPRSDLDAGRGRTSERADKDRVRAVAEAGSGAPMSKGWVSLHFGRALERRTATVQSEPGCPLQPLDPKAHNSWAQEPYSGGLGWNFPAVLGVQLGAPARLVLNNEEWSTVRRSNTGLYPRGIAAGAKAAALTALQPSPDFTRTAAASRAGAETVSDGADLPETLNRAIAVTQTKKRLTPLNIKIARQ